MKITNIAITTALTLVAGPVAAAEMYCSVKDTRGALTSYKLADYSGSMSQEISVERNGSVLTHASDARPLWKSDVVDGVIIMTYVPRPEYRLGVGSVGEIENGIDMRKAILMRGDTRIAMGFCGMKNNDLRPAGTTGGRRVQTF